MSLHSYSRVWLHIVWATLERRPLLDKPAAAKLSTHLHDYARQKNIYMKINYVNSDHVHALVDLPTSKSIAEVVQLFKGSSSHWINQNRLLRGRFLVGPWRWSLLSLSIACASSCRICRRPARPSSS